MSPRLFLLAYRRSGLSLQGIGLREALRSPLIRMGLEGIVRAWAKRDGKPAPDQSALI